MNNGRPDRGHRVRAITAASALSLAVGGVMAADLGPGRHAHGEFDKSWRPGEIALQP